jgi:dTDP-4-dehydrorhamnose reductase
VIGARGLLGREVCRAAIARGAEVRRTSRESAPGWTAFDVTCDDPASLFRGETDVVVNCAALLASDIAAGTPDVLKLAELVNAEFPHALAGAASRAGARVIHVSTDAVFADGAGTCREDSTDFSDEIYGSSKRRGEPISPTALTLRASFVGRDPLRRRGLLEWLIAQPDGSAVAGFTDQLWNGVVASQLAALCASLLDEGLFTRARAEGPIHHVFQDPPLTKAALLESAARVFDKRVDVIPTESDQPVSRLLGTLYSTAPECLESGPTREAALVQLAQLTDQEAHDRP